jgi:hypothetical protein
VVLVVVAQVLAVVAVRARRVVVLWVRLVVR